MLLVLGKDFLFVLKDEFQGRTIYVSDNQLSTCVTG